MLCETGGEGMSAIDAPQPERDAMPDEQANSAAMATAQIDNARLGKRTSLRTSTADPRAQLRHGQHTAGSS